ncbi:thioredoxin [Mucilaginibacter sp. dw_454]|uniref:thioredoxin n=1 Tax=Mucilaginibacter sp. dw_454 TaxID=2720079 RepID=UPI001BD5852C|nr:thioredoxin [Mucilaginibacter sp. dw_454]
MAIVITDENFEELVLRSTKPVLLDFWADWCSPCKMISPVIDEMYTDYKEVAIIAKIDAERNPLTAKRYKVSHVPALLFFKSGELVDRQAGPVPKNILAEKLNRFV